MAAIFSIKSFLRANMRVLSGFVCTCESVLCVFKKKKAPQIRLENAVLRKRKRLFQAIKAALLGAHRYAFSLQKHSDELLKVVI